MSKKRKFLLLCCSAALLTACDNPSMFRASTQPSARLIDPTLSDTTTPSGETITPVDNGDGTWSYDSPLPLGTLLQEADSVITWKYQEQARFEYAVAELDRSVVVQAQFTQQGPDLRSSLERVSGWRKVDNEGRVWVVDSIDQEAWDARIEAGEDRDALDAAEPVGVATDGPDIVDHKIGDVVPWRPHGWSFGCTTFDDVWDGESRVAVASLLERQKASVLVFAKQTWAGQTFTGACSGVLLEPGVVLTAAHCAMNINNSGADTAVTGNNLKICSWGNFYTGAQCRTGVSQVRASEFNPDIDASFDVATGTIEDLAHGDDWAIIELIVPFTNTTEQDMSTLSSLGSKDVLTFGFPAQHPEGSVGDCNVNVTGTVDDPTIPPLGQLYRQLDVNITDFSNAEARGKLDAMNAQSGSPVYICSGSDDDCDVADEGRTVMVLSGSEGSGIFLRIVGPRIPYWRSDILAEVND